MRGFEHLSLEETVRGMHEAEQEFVDRFFRENPNVKLLSSTVPEGVDYAFSENEIYLVASRKFDVGEKIYTNVSTVIPYSEFKVNKYIIQCRNRFVLLNEESHFMHRPDYVECAGFDCFMDHSCDPCTDQNYESASTYTVYAVRTILPGEKMTCDYRTLDNKLQKASNLPTTSFMCKCGAANCQGWIAA